MSLALRQEHSYPVPIPITSSSAMDLLDHYRRTISDLKRERTLLRRKLTPEEKDVVDRYADRDADGFAIHINAFLRSGKVVPAAEKSRYVALFDSVFQKTGGRRFDGLLFRGLGGDTGVRFRVGSIVHFAGYTSTSFLPIRAASYSKGVVLVFRDIGDTRYIYAPREDEVVLERDTRWKVIKTYLHRFTADELMHPSCSNCRRYPERTEEEKKTFQVVELSTVVLTISR